MLRLDVEGAPVLEAKSPWSLGSVHMDWARKDYDWGHTDWEPIKGMLSNLT